MKEVPLSDLSTGTSKYNACESRGVVKITVQALQSSIRSDKV